MSTSVPPRLPDRNSRLAKAIIFFLVAMVFVLVSSFTLWRLSLHSKVSEHWSEARAKGEPTTWDELDRWYTSVPDGENMALVYTQALAQLETGVGPRDMQDWSRVPLPRRGDEPAPGLLTNLQQIVTSNLFAVSAARRASLLSQSRYPIDLSVGPTAQLPHLAKLKKMALLLEIEAFVDVKAGRMSEAAESVEASLALSRSLKTEPTTISQLVAVALDEVSCRSLERLVNLVKLSETQLARFAVQLAEAEATNRFVVALIGERVLYGQLISMAQNDPSSLAQYQTDAEGGEENSAGPIRDPGLGWRALGFFERDLEFFLSAMDKSIATARLLPPRSIAATNTIDMMSDEARRTYRILSGLLLPSIARLPQKDAQHRARLRVASAAVAVERFRLAQSGRIPDSLSELPPQLLSAVPTDPFDGQPLRLKRLGRGYVIYSIGGDGQDDGGKEQAPRGAVLTKEQRQQSKYHDVTFILER